MATISNQTRKNGTLQVVNPNAPQSSGIKVGGTSNKYNSLEDLVKAELSNKSKTTSMLINIGKKHFPSKSDDIIKAVINSMINQGLLTNDIDGNLTLL